MSKFFDKPFSEMPSVEAVGGGLFKKTRGDKYIWGIVLFLALTSLLVVYSATGSLAYKLYKGNTEVYLFKQFAFIVSWFARYIFCASHKLYFILQGSLVFVFSFYTLTNIHLLFWCKN